MDGLRHKVRARMCPAYVAGLIGAGDRNSVQPMAARDGGIGYDQLHHFIASGVWAAAPIEKVLFAEADRMVGVVLRRLGLGRLEALDPNPPVIRYERERPGELIHIDSKKLGRIDGVGHCITGDRRGQSGRRARGQGLGWGALHVAVDDASRLAYTEILPDEKKESATAFLERALDFFTRHGVTVERVMTDNGSAYKSHLFRDALGARAIT